MGIVGSVDNSQSLSLVTSDTDTKTDNTSSESFESFMRQALTLEVENTVNEEELFSGLVKERVRNLKGDDDYAKFQSILDSKSESMRRADGYVPWEDVAKGALKEAVSQKLISEDEAVKIYSESFSAAQLDSNENALYDGRGGDGDTTIATLDYEAALALALGRFEKFDSGEQAAVTRDLNEPSNGTSGSVSSPESVAVPGKEVDGADGFLFKPVSDSDGKVAVLLPSSLTGTIEKVVFETINGEVLEEGRYSGVGNGGREHYRFSKTGAEYESNLVVNVFMKDGTNKTYEISDPSKRYD